MINPKKAVMNREDLESGSNIRGTTAEGSSEEEIVTNRSSEPKNGRRETRRSGTRRRGECRRGSSGPPSLSEFKVALNNMEEKIRMAAGLELELL